MKSFRYFLIFFLLAGVCTAQTPLNSVMLNITQSGTVTGVVVVSFSVSQASSVYQTGNWMVASNFPASSNFVTASWALLGYQNSLKKQSVQSTSFWYSANSYRLMYDASYSNWSGLVTNPVPPSSTNRIARYHCSVSWNNPNDEFSASCYVVIGGNDDTATVPDIGTVPDGSKRPAPNGRRFVYTVLIFNCV